MGILVDSGESMEGERIRAVFGTIPENWQDHEYSRRLMVSTSKNDWLTFTFGESIYYEEVR